MTCTTPFIGDLTFGVVLPGTSYEIDLDCGNLDGTGQQGHLQFSDDEITWHHLEDVTLNSGALDVVLRATGQFWRVVIAVNTDPFCSIGLTSNTVDLDS